MNCSTSLLLLDVSKRSVVFVVGGLQVFNKLKAVAVVFVKTLQIPVPFYVM